MTMKRNSVEGHSTMNDKFSHIDHAQFMSLTNLKQRVRHLKFEAIRLQSDLYPNQQQFDSVLETIKM